MIIIVIFVRLTWWLFLPLDEWFVGYASGPDGAQRACRVTEGRCLVKVKERAKVKIQQKHQQWFFKDILTISWFHEQLEHLKHLVQQPAPWGWFVILRWWQSNKKLPEKLSATITSPSVREHCTLAQKILSGEINRGEEANLLHWCDTVQHTLSKRGNLDIFLNFWRPNRHQLMFFLFVHSFLEVKVKLTPTTKNLATKLWLVNGQN